MSWLITPELKTVEGIPWDQIPENLKWTPASIQTSIWFDADDAATISLSSGVVSTWTDKSGNSRTLVQSSTGQGPTVTPIGIGNRTSLSFEQQTLINSNVGLPVGSSARSMFAVYQPLRLTGTNGVCGQGASSVNGAWFYLEFRTSPQGDPYFAGYFADLSSGTPITLAPKIGEVVYTGSTATLYSTGSQIASGNLNLATDGNEFRVGSSRAGAMVGMVGEVIYISSAVDANTRQRIEGYLAHKWNLLSGLPANHPYKTTAPTV